MYRDGLARLVGFSATATWLVLSACSGGGGTGSQESIAGNSGLPTSDSASDSTSTVDGPADDSALGGAGSVAVPAVDQTGPSQSAAGGVMGVGQANAGSVGTEPSNGSGGAANVAAMGGASSSNDLMTTPSSGGTVNAGGSQNLGGQAVSSSQGPGGGAAVAAAGNANNGVGGADLGQAGAPGTLNGGAGGGAQQTPFPDQVEAPVSDSGSNLPIAGPGGQYEVDGNIPYGDLPQQRLDVMYPRGGGPDASEKLAGVIMFHGGGWIQGDKATMSSFYSRFLAHGFVVCSAEYRVADGDADHIAPAAVEDALLAAKWFWDYLDYYNVDRERYVVTGASAGGHLALMVGMATPEAMLGPTSPKDFKIAAVVNGYGPADVPDLLQRNTSWAVQWLPANTPGRDALAERLSPISYVRADIPPLISVHGSNDTTVPVAQSQHLDELLQAAGADAEIHVVSGAGHGFSSPAGAWPDAEQAMFDFLTARGIGK